VVHSLGCEDSLAAQPALNDDRMLPTRHYGPDRVPVCM
jgi:hypothetical protein